MSDEILSRCLEVGLINVGGDDNKLAKLSESVEDVVALLSKSPSKTAVFTIVAVDPNVPANDPALLEVYSLIKNRWTTIANTYSSTPIAVIRCVLLAALVRSARQSELQAIVFVNVARNTLPNVEAGPEGSIWLEAVAELERKVDARAVAEWATPETIKLPALSYKAPDTVVIPVPTITIDQAALQVAIVKASGPTNQHGNDQNPYWMHNNPQQWIPEFSKRMSQGLVNAIENAENGDTKEIDLGPVLTTLAKAVSIHMQTALTSFSNATAGLQRRTNLLWWKESLYSSSAQVSYRTLPPFMAAALMALDLHTQVPTFSPASVSAFLDETIGVLTVGLAAAERPTIEVVRETIENQSLGPLRAAALTYAPELVGRGLLLAVLGHMQSDAVIDQATFERFCGPCASTSVTPRAWGTMLYRELQAGRAGVSRGKSEGK